MTATTKAAFAVRPRENLDELNTRARLLRAATECFAARGYEGTSTREIAERAEVATQLIIYHFGSKEHLWREAVASLQEEFRATVDGLRFDKSGDLTEQFRQHMRLMFTDRLERPHIARIWTQEFLGHHERFGETIEPILKEFEESLAAPYARKLVRLGIVQNFTALEAGLIRKAILQLAVLNPFLVEWALGKPVKSTDSIDFLVDLLVRILTVPRADARAAAPLGGADSETRSSASSRGPRPATRAAFGDTERLELKQIIAELTIENRRLRKQLRSKNSAPRSAANRRLDKQKPRRS